MRRHKLLYLAAASTVGLSSLAHGQYSWRTNFVGSWSTGTNWTGNVAPPNGAAGVNFFASGASIFSANQNIASPFSLSFVSVSTTSTGTSVISGNPLLFVPYNISNIIAAPSIDLVAQNSGSVNGSVGITAELQSTGSLNIYNESTGTLALNGNTTGPGALVTHGNIVVLNGNNTAAGGLQVFRGNTIVRSNGLLSGPVSVGGDTLISNYGFAALLTVTGSSNFSGTDARVRVRDDGIIGFDNLNTSATARLSPLSQGVIAITPSQSVNFSQSETATPYMSIGTAIPGFAGAGTIGALLSGPAGKLTFGGQLCDDVSVFGSDKLNVTSPITQSTSNSSVIVGAQALSGGKVIIRGTSNNYLGGTTVLPDRYGGLTALTFDYTPTAGQTPLGSGTLTVNGALLFEGAAGAVGSLSNAINFRPGSSLIFNNIVSTASNSFSSQSLDRWGDTKAIALNGTTIDLKSFSNVTETVGTVSLTGSNRMTISSYDSTSVGTGTIDMAGLTRSDPYTTLYLQGGSATGRYYKVRNYFPSQNLVDPTIVMEDATNQFFHPGEFLTVNSGSLLVPYTYDTTFGVTPSQVVATGSPTTITGNYTARAWRMSGAATLTTGSALTLNALSMNDTATITGGSIGAPNGLIVFVNTNGAGTIASVISSASAFTKFGPGSLVVTGNSALSGRIDLNDGTLGIGSFVQLSTSAIPQITIAPYASMDFYGGTQSFAVNGEIGSSINAKAGANITVTPIGVEILSVAAGARLNLPTSNLGNGAFAIRRLGVAPSQAPTGKFDIKNNSVVLDYIGSSPIGQIKTWLSSGYAGGAWTGGGILSSTAAANGTAIGYAEATDLFTTFPATYLGQTLDPSELIIRATLTGDANLDRTVSSVDFNQFAGNYGSSIGTWFTGDFNYDGVVDTRDFAALIASFGRTFPTNGELPGAPVPEPIGGLLIAGPLLLVRRRR